MCIVSKKKHSRRAFNVDILNGRHSCISIIFARVNRKYKADRHIMILWETHGLMRFKFQYKSARCHSWHKRDTASRYLYSVANSMPWESFILNTLALKCFKNKSIGIERDSFPLILEDYSFSVTAPNPAGGVASHIWRTNVNIKTYDS